MSESRCFGLICPPPVAILAQVRRPQDYNLSVSVYSCLWHPLLPRSVFMRGWSDGDYLWRFHSCWHVPHTLAWHSSHRRSTGLSVQSASLASQLYCLVSRSVGQSRRQPRWRGNGASGAWAFALYPRMPTAAYTSGMQVHEQQTWSHACACAAL